MLKFEAEWESLERGTPEERACYAAIGIRYGDVWLTEADDAFVKRVREKVHLSAYKLAEWLAWNWWRLRWEPRTRAQDWPFAHRMATIGGGYIWPNITVSSDGERIVLLAKPTRSRLQEPLRYIADIPAVVRARAFEGAVDSFIDQVRGQLRAEGIPDTNLDHIWDDVLAERVDPARTSYRRFEALLGLDPDEAEHAVIEALIADSETLGEEAMSELAANKVRGGGILTAAELSEAADAVGFDSSLEDTARLATDTRLPEIGQVPAWTRGAEAARALRMQEHLGAAPVSNRRLAEMAGTASAVLTEHRASVPDFSFSLDRSAMSSRVVLRSRWKTGRRFELARLIGDRVADGAEGRLFPATRAYTYRQKLQRSFAAELLCPFEALKDMLGDDCSNEAIEDAAEHYEVSERTVRTLLVNHDLLDRDDIDGEFEAAAVA